MSMLLHRAETALDRLLRSPAARYGGLVIGVAALVFLGRSLAQAGDAALEWFTSLSPVQLVAAAAAFAVAHLGLVWTLRPLFGGPALRVWGAGQLVKYLPVPGSVFIGIVGSTVRGGGTTRHGVQVTVRHSLLHVGAATAVGALAAGPALQAWLGVPALLTAVLLLVAGLVLALVSVRTLGLAVGTAVVALAVVTWMALGLLLWFGVAQGNGSAWQVTGAFAAAWVVGQLALPVPAGIGVREWILVVLLTPVIGQVGALSFALGTRLIHVVSDAVVAALVLSRGGWRELRRRRVEPDPGANSDAGATSDPGASSDPDPRGSS
jgi:glycosyltransferase 2 family protein